MTEGAVAICRWIIFIPWLFNRPPPPLGTPPNLGGELYNDFNVMVLCKPSHEKKLHRKGSRSEQILVIPAIREDLLVSMVNTCWVINNDTPTSLCRFRMIHTAINKCWIAIICHKISAFLWVIIRSFTTKYKVVFFDFNQKMKFYKKIMVFAGLST